MEASTTGKPWPQRRRDMALCSVDCNIYLSANSRENRVLRLRGDVSVTPSSLRKSMLRIKQLIGCGRVLCETDCPAIGGRQ